MVVWSSTVSASPPNSSSRQAPSANARPPPRSPPARAPAAAGAAMSSRSGLEHGTTTSRKTALRHRGWNGSPPSAQRGGGRIARAVRALPSPRCARQRRRAAQAGKGTTQPPRGKNAGGASSPAVARWRRSATIVPDLSDPAGQARRGVLLSLVLELQRVDDGGDRVGIAAADFDAVTELPGRVPLAEQVVGGGLRRARAAGDELNVHRAARLRSGPSARSPARWR